VTDRVNLWGQEPTLLEYQIKAAIVYQILPFIEWPIQPNRNSSPSLNLCILGENPFGTAFDAFQGETIHGQKLFIRPAESIRDLKNCQILFICPSEKGRALQIVKQPSDLGILTIGDSEGLAQLGVMINFYMERKKVRVELNIDAARKAGFKINPHFLKLVRIIRESS